MEKFKERKIAKILMLITITIFLASIVIGFIISMIYWNSIIFLGIFLLSLPVVCVIGLIASALSNRNKYTREFITYMNSKIDSATTLNDLYEIKDEFYNLAVEDGMYNLSYPLDLKVINHRILNQIEILEKINKK